MLELKEVDDWKSLGVALGVPVYVLNQVKQSNGGVKEWKIEVYQYWLNMADAPSWRIIVDVLDQLGYYRLARKIRSTYLQKPSSEVVEAEGSSVTSHALMCIIGVSCIHHHFSMTNNCS